MLAGLCNICDEHGHGNFEKLKQLVEEVGRKSTEIVASNVNKELRYLKNRFKKEAEVHSSCLELCLSFAFGSCSKEYPHTTSQLDSFYCTINGIQDAISQMEPVDQADLEKQLAECFQISSCSWAIFCGQKHQASYYQFVVNNLKNWL